MVSDGRQPVKVTFFVNSIVGYVDNASALYTRALAHGLALRGNDVRVVEPRQNEQLARTLRAVGSSASRHVHEAFPLFQYTSFEPRSGARLLEWVTREVALIDVAVAVGGVDDELCRWLANVTRDELTRAYLAWEPADLTQERVSYLEIEKYDVILTLAAPSADVDWVAVQRSIALQDMGDATGGYADSLPVDLRDPLGAAIAFERAVARPDVARGAGR